MNENAVTWGADFWQRVLISGLGTLGSLFIGLVLFWLGRRVVKAEKAKEEAEKKLDRERERFKLAASQLLAYFSEFMAISVEPVSVAWTARYYDCLRRLLPVASQGLFQFRGTPLYDRIKDFTSTAADQGEAQLKNTETQDIADVMSRDAIILNWKAMRLHGDLLKAIEEIDRVS